MSYQKTIIVGNLGRDPEMRYMPDGRAITSFSIATSRKWKDSSGQTVDETTWFRVSAFGGLAETCNQYLSKGSRVLVEGRLKPDPQTGGPKVFTRQDGSTGASFELAADVVRFMGRNDNAAVDVGRTVQTEQDEIPF